MTNHIDNLYSRIIELEQKVETLSKIINIKVFRAERGNCIVVKLQPPVHGDEVRELVAVLRNQIIKTLDLAGDVRVIVTDATTEISLANDDVAIEGGNTIGGGKL